MISPAEDTLMACQQYQYVPFKILEVNTSEAEL
jgi:hypothetical protein